MSRRSEATAGTLFVALSMAIWVHGGTYVGVGTYADYKLGKSDLRGLASMVRASLRPSNEVMEVFLPEQEAKPDEPVVVPPADAPKPPPPAPVAKKDAEPKKDPPKKAPEPPKKVVVVEPPKPAAPAPPQPPPPPMDKRVAVKQHVEDKNQKDNPDAEHIADEANHVKEESVATITSHSQDDKKPTPGASKMAPKEEPGNAEKTRIADSDDHAGDKSHPPGEKTPDKPSELPKPAGKPNAASAQAPPAGLPPSDKAGQNGRSGPRVASQQPAPTPPSPPTPAAAPPPTPEVVASPNGAEAVSPFRKPDAPKPEASAGVASAAPPTATSQRPFSIPRLGGGAGPNGINFNLSPGGAVATIGEQTLKREREMDGERRKSAHRGSWKASGLDRWRAAIENYVSSVKPGNQTALNTASVPFASFLNLIHNRLHPIFADDFLGSLDGLPDTHMLNQPKLSTSIEVVVDGEHGRIVKMGVVKTSGVTAFDIAALDSMQRASGGASAGFGKPPTAIVSNDGNVYLHWEFHRRPEIACSTINARPFMLNHAPAINPTPAAPLPGPRAPVDPREQGAPPPAAPSREGHLGSPAPARERYARAPTSPQAG